VKSKILVILALIFVRCATTSISAIRNKEVEPITFNRIMVFAPFEDIGWRQKTEASFVSKMLRKEIYGKLGPPRNPYYKDYVETHYAETCSCGVSSIDIIPPFREYSPEDLRSRYSKSKIDGILVVALEDFWTTDFQVFKYLSYTQSVIGYTVSKPRMMFDVRLVDVASGEIVWMATAVTAGNAFADRSDLLESLAGSIAEELFKEKFLIEEIKHNLK
jgi:hypothetical protein